MKALTVQQPWAWAIIHADPPKDVENRTQAWGYRGPLAIHAGARLSDRGLESPLIQAAWRRAGEPPIMRSEAGAIIGVVDLVDVHTAPADCMVDGLSLCCQSAWAETSYAEHHGSTTPTRRDIVHLVLEHPRPLPEPIPCRGALGLWTPPDEVLEQILELANGDTR